MKYWVKPPRRLLVANRRNSKCAVPLSDLDWSVWWVDGAPDIYLHVPHIDGERVMRVFCRYPLPRLEFKDGKLYWLIDAAQEQK